VLCGVALYEGGFVMKRKDQINAFLGKDTEFEGKLSFNGAVRIDGRLKGEIFTEGTLIVGESAVIASDIHVSHIIVSGEIRGNIVASDRIEIHAPGKVFGNIQAPTVIIDEGVVFEGNCKMQSAKETDEKKVAIIREGIGTE
jgi:cytoskeletal protein CcmA (bactofilin family)